MIYDWKEIPHSEWDYVKAYHVEVISELERRLKRNPDILKKYRIDNNYLDR